MIRHLQTHIGVRLSVFYSSIPYTLSVPVFLKAGVLYGNSVTCMWWYLLTSMVGESDHHFMYGETSYLYSWVDYCITRFL